MFYSCVVMGLLFIAQSSQAFEAPSGPEAWLWTENDLMSNAFFNYYYLHDAVFNELVLCVMECMQIRECQSFTVDNNNNEFHCTFHNRIFSYYEKTYLSSPQNGLVYYMISSNCPMRESHFFSREAKMCVSVNVVKRKKTDARQYCQLGGGDIVTIDNDDKEAFIALMMEGFSTWQQICFHVNAQAVTDVYKWANGATVSSSILKEVYDPSNECVEIQYAGTNDLTGQLYDCTSKRMAVICEYQL